MKKIITKFKKDQAWAILAMGGFLFAAGLIGFGGACLTVGTWALYSADGDIFLPMAGAIMLWAGYDICKQAKIIWESL